MGAFVFFFQQKNLNTELFLCRSSHKRESFCLAGQLKKIRFMKTNLEKIERGKKKTQYFVSCFSISFPSGSVRKHNFHQNCGHPNCFHPKLFSPELLSSENVFGRIIFARGCARPKRFSCEAAFGRIFENPKLFSAGSYKRLNM